MTWEMYWLDKVITLFIGIVSGGVAGVVAGVVLLRVFGIGSVIETVNRMVAIINKIEVD